MDWEHFLLEPPDALRWHHDFGHGLEPGDPFGRERLTLSPVGALRLEWWQGEQHAVWTAQVPQELVFEVLEATARAGFPDIPMSLLSPGPGSARDLVVELDEHHAQAVVARKLWSGPHLQRLFAIVDSLVAQVRERPVYGDDPCPGAVTAVARVGA